jgi:hypothetical protein
MHVQGLENAQQVEVEAGQIHDAVLQGKGLENTAYSPW